MSEFAIMLMWMIPVVASSALFGFSAFVGMTKPAGYRPKANPSAREIPPPPASPPPLLPKGSGIVPPHGGTGAHPYRSRCCCSCHREQA